MSQNRFNQYTSQGDANVTDGSLDIFGYSLRASNLNPGQALKTNSINQLISTKLDISDINNLQAELDSSIQNPNQSNLISDGVEVTAGNVLKTNVLQKTSGTFISVKDDLRLDPEITLRTNFIGEGDEGSGVTISDELKCSGDISTDTIPSVNNAISDLDIRTQYISVDENETSFSSNIKLDAGKTLLTDNILMSGNLDMGTFSVTNSSSVFTENTQTNQILPNPDIDPNNISVIVPTINYNVVNANFNGQPGEEIEQRYTRQGNNWGTIGTDSDSFFLSNFGNGNVDLALRGTGGKQLRIIDDESKLVIDNLDVSISGANSFTATTVQTNSVSSKTEFIPITLTSGLNAPGVTFSGMSQVQCTDLGCDRLQPNTGTSVLVDGDLDFQNTHNLLNCPSINGIRPSGGVFSESSNFSLSGIQAEQDVLNTGVSYGSLSIPANSFQPGDAYAIKIGGTITCDNNDVFTLRLRSNFGGSSPIFAQFVVTVDGGQTNGWWELEAEFIVRAIGAATVASMSTNGAFTYFNSTQVSKGYGVNTVEQTLFDTTVSNVLNLTYETAEVSITAFAISQVMLTKLY